MKIIDHIGIFENYFSNELCIKYIDFFNKNNKRLKRNNDIVQDESINLRNEDFEFQNIFWKECYSKYIETYSILNKMQRHNILDIKIQKTKPSEGYHMWHCENMSLADRNRIMSFILYLNTVENGETEFLNQKLKINPVQGKLILWPANYTHVHRGNSPLQDKYIITGWIEYAL